LPTNQHNESSPTNNSTTAPVANTLEAFPLLHRACHSQNAAGVRSILRIGNDPNEKTRTEGWTPLWIAACYGNLEISKLLLDAGANVNARNRQGSTPLREASLLGATELVRLLLQHGADTALGTLEFADSPIIAAASKGHTETVNALLENGADVNAQASGGWCALHYAFLVKSKELVTLIFDTCPNVDVNPSTLAGVRPLHLAAIPGFSELASELIDRGAEIDAIDNGGLTALRVAVEHGQLETVKMLISRGARTDIISHVDGMSLTNVALIQGHDEVFEYLQEIQTA
jgi:ankyrin repeat protein